jgi:putative hydrolase of the HAD superfamily
VTAPIALAELEAVLFDAGGTLVRLDYAFIARRAREHGAALDVEALHRAEVAARQAVDRAAARHGGAPGSDAGRTRGYFRTLLEAAGAPPAIAARAVAHLLDDHRADNLWRVPLEGAGETLRGLRARGLRTAVVSNADGRVERTLEATGLARHLECVVDSHVEGVEKPDPEIFRRALSRLGIAAGRAAYVGDIYSIDALGARAAGLRPVLIDTTRSYGPLDCPTITALYELLA